MKRHPFDAVSLVAATVFGGLAGIWLAHRIIGDTMHPAWTLAAVLVLMGGMIAASALNRSHAPARSAAEPGSVATGGPAEYGLTQDPELGDTMSETNAHPTAGTDTAVPEPATDTRVEPAADGEQTATEAAPAGADDPPQPRD